MCYIYYFICDIPEVGIAKKHPARFAFEIYDFTRNACMSANMLALFFRFASIIIIMLANSFASSGPIYIEFNVKTYNNVWYYIILQKSVKT